MVGLILLVMDLAAAGQYWGNRKPIMLPTLEELYMD